ncbi:protein of unknown function [Methylococcus capsulatus]|uniref:Uncharacterized protein n=1 Tax=Methylococcus capsulatus TaxID=414 RepID=A0AA35XZY7_METCP|nr:protein of unknown function [Methylococcus capsulatus]
MDDEDHRTPEGQARKTIDELLTAAGRHVADADRTNILARRGFAIREFPLPSGHGFADYRRWCMNQPMAMFSLSLLSSEPVHDLPCIHTSPSGANPVRPASACRSGP